MQLISGFVFGMLTVAYTPDLGMKIRALTNSAATEVQSATEEETLWRQLQEQTVDDLKGALDEVGK